MPHFFMAMQPPTVTHQDKELHAYLANGKPRATLHDSAELRVARAKLHAYLAPHRPEAPAAGAVRLTVKWCFDRTGTAHADGEWRTTRPDTDNLEKTLKDVMTELGWWRDDAQVASEICEKFWASVPGIWIRWEEI